jgi:hypothetical protein
MDAKNYTIADRKKYSSLNWTPFSSHKCELAGVIGTLLLYIKSTSNMKMIKI